MADIARFMIETSDNSATNIIMSKIGGVEAINDEIRRMGYTQTRLERFMHDQVAINQGLDNYISAKEAGDLLKNIYNGTLISETADRQMLNNLSNNYYDWWLPSGVKDQAGVKVYDKPGNHLTMGIANDIVAITKNGRAYILSVLTENNGGNGSTNTWRFANLAKSVVAKLG